MLKLEMKNYSTKLTEKQQKYQHYHQVKLININILQVKKYLQIQIIEQGKVNYCLLGKDLEIKQKQLKIKGEKSNGK